MAVITAATGRRSPASKWMMVRRLTSLADTNPICVISRRIRPMPVLRRRGGDKAAFVTAEDGF
jgi:hypothetical protein